jgi:hypothetical protein
MLPVATCGNTSADTQPDGDLERLARRVTQFEEQCRWLRRRLRFRVAAPRCSWGVLAVTSAVGANLNAQAGPRPGEGRAVECLRVRRLAVVDAVGFERVLIAAPLPPAGEG